MTMTIESNNHSNRNGKSAQDLVAANIQFLIEQLEAGHSEVLTHYLNAMARFHHYSFGNVLLIARQKPDASHVAGIRTWNSLGRFVRKGEKGIFILAPMIGRKRGEKPEPSGEAEDAKTELIGFRGVYVFDVAQTDGKELPTVEAVKGDPGAYLAKLVNFTMGQGITFGYSEKIAPAEGISYGGKIQLLPDMSEGEQFSTLVHELAHEMLHKSNRRTLITKTVRETEAEAVAFVVSQSIGLSTGTASSDYIQLYHGDAKLLQESLEIVQRTATAILGAIRPEVVETAAAA